MNKSAQRVVNIIQKKAGKLFRFIGILVAAGSFLLAISSLLILSDDPTARSVVSGYEWLAVASLVIWLPAILWVLFDEFMELIADYEK